MNEETKIQANRTAGTPDSSKSMIPASDCGVKLTSMEDMYRFAKCVTMSGLAPKGMDKPETVLVAIQSGMEVGFSPMQALQNVVVVNGKPRVYGDAGLALVRGRDVLEDYKEEVSGSLDNETRKWIVTLKRRGQTAISREFSVDEAKRAGLWRKAGPWTMFPDRMLRYRALSFALRDGFSDILMGLGIAEEDYVDTKPKNVTAEVEVSDARALQFEASEVKPEQPAVQPEQVIVSSKLGVEEISPAQEAAEIVSPPKSMSSTITAIKQLIEKSSEAKVKKAMLAVGVKTEDGESWEQGSIEQLKSLASLLKC